MFDPTHDSNFVAALALHAHKRDTALFEPGYVSTHTRGLIHYYNHLARQETPPEAYRAERDRLLAELAAGADPEEINRQINRLACQLEIDQQLRNRNG